MKAQELLANELNCSPQGIADKLWPISKGYTEHERIDNLNAVLSAINGMAKISFEAGELYGTAQEQGGTEPNFNEFIKDSVQ